MNRNDQKSIASLYVENINQMGARTASQSQMADMLSKHPAANEPQETSMSFNAPTGYDVSYDGKTLTVSRNLNDIKSKTMTNVGTMDIEDLQKAVDYQVAYDEFIAARTGGDKTAKQNFTARSKEIYRK